MRKSNPVVSATTYDERGIYFNSGILQRASYEYVAWLDVMGTANQMVRSLPIAANFVFKLHCAVLTSYDQLERDDRDCLRLYPVIDGVYITSTSRGPVQNVLVGALQQCVTTFLNAKEPFHHFIVRAAIAFGPVYHGCDLPLGIANILESHKCIRDAMFIGAPLSQAYREERNAPPFGVAIDESARTFAPGEDQPFRFVWFDWYAHTDPQVDRQAVLKKLNWYFDWQTEHCNMTGYELSRIDHHRKLSAECWGRTDVRLCR